MDWLSPTSTTSHCPYKGTATYWNLTVNGAELEVDVDGQRIGRP